MELVGAAAGDGDNLIGATELGGGAGGDDLEFLQTVERRPFAEPPFDPGELIGNAIEAKGDGAGARAAGDGGGDAKGGEPVLASGVLDAGGEGHEPDDVQPSVERDLREGFGVDDFADGGAFRVDGGEFGIYFDALFGAADLEGNVEESALPDFEGDARLFEGPKAGEGGRDAVASRAEKGGEEVAAWF